MTACCLPRTWELLERANFPPHRDWGCRSPHALFKCTPATPNGLPVLTYGNLQLAGHRPDGIGALYRVPAKGLPFEGSGGTIVTAGPLRSPLGTALYPSPISSGKSSHGPTILLGLVLRCEEDRSMSLLWWPPLRHRTTRCGIPPTHLGAPSHRASYDRRIEEVKFLVAPYFGWRRRARSR